jgi:hypothetical protein
MIQFATIIDPPRVALEEPLSAEPVSPTAATEPIVEVFVLEEALPPKGVRARNGFIGPPRAVKNQDRPPEQLFLNFQFSSQDSQTADADLQQV